MLNSPQGQRLFDRIDVRFSARSNRNSATAVDDIVIKDFSPIGMKVFSTEQLFLFDRLSISFIPHGDASVEINGYVIWIEEDSPCSWHIGVQFDQVDLLKANRMLKFIQ